MEKKHIPLVVGGAAAVAAVTLSVTCLCCGMGAWVFPTRREKPVATSPRESAPLESDPPSEPDAVPTKGREEADVAYDENAASTERDLELVKKALKLHPDFAVLQPGQFIFDQVGLLGRAVTVVQVLDEKNALVRIEGRRIPGRPRSDPTTSTLLWITGASTDLWVDDEHIKIDGAFLVAGKRQYETTIGASKTVYVLRWMDPVLVEKARTSLDAEKRNP